MLLLCKNCHILQNRSLINNVPNHYQQNLKRSVAYNKKKKHKHTNWGRYATDITSKHYNCLKHIYCQMKDKQSRAFSNFPWIHKQT